MIIFKYIAETNNIGKIIKRPVADIFLKNQNGGWLEFHPYIDSGADITLIPLSLGKLLGFSSRNKKLDRIGGIGGSIPIIYLQNKMKIGENEFLAQIGWALTEKVPPLLGRAGVFDQFHITFKQKEQLIVFE